MDNKEYWEEKDRRDKAQKEENGRTVVGFSLMVGFVVAVVAILSVAC